MAVAAFASTGAWAQMPAPCAPAVGQACPDPARPRPAVPQTWTIIESRSPADDRPQISASIWVEKDQSILALRCFDGRMEVMFSSTALATPDAAARVTYRIDGAAPVTRQWRAAANRQDLFAPDPQRLLRALPDQGSLLIRAQGRARTAVEASFAYRGLNEVRARFAARCVRAPARPLPPVAPQAADAPENEAPESAPRAAAPPPPGPVRAPAAAPVRPADGVDDLDIRSLAAPPAPPSFANRPLRRLPEE
ncbi:hypothetical protein [Roseixanthobacter liquoris]|uniref:hypothetical protein n=1 Tax=Roseixanthobacter liquoris TaxID=3119921 RepID=UPI00372A76E1